MEISKHASGQKERELFLEAVDKTTPAERAAYLDSVCGRNTPLRFRMELLLERSEKIDTFLEKPVISLPSPKRDLMLSTTESIVPGERAGDRIGRFKLVEKIGEGGCGVVYWPSRRNPSAAASRSK
jgi:hypothetical protein